MTSRAVVVMGPAGSGKTTVGRALAQRLGWRFIEGDDFHPASNVRKMASGQPLTDEDRGPWLEKLAEELRKAAEGKENVVLACSALKDAYRARLRVHPGVRFVFLDAPAAVLEKRIRERKGHFVPPTLIVSQLADLERPDGDRVDATRPVPEIVGSIADRLPPS